MRDHVTQENNRFIAHIYENTVVGPSRVATNVIGLVRIHMKSKTTVRNDFCIKIRYF